MKLAEMNGFPGLLQSNLSIPPEENMFLRSSESNVHEVFMHWYRDGNCFEEGKKLQLKVARHPAVLNSIDNQLILTGVGINAFIKSVSNYLDIMLHLPLCADFVASKLLNLVDYYVYAVTTLFSTPALLNTLFVVTNGAATYPYIIPFIKRCQTVLFPEQVIDVEEMEDVTEAFTPLSSITQEVEDELGVPQPILNVDESMLQENLEVRRIVAAESTRLFTALFAAIRPRVESLAPITKTAMVQEYITMLPHITQDLCKMFYRSSSYTILQVGARKRAQSAEPRRIQASHSQAEVGNPLCEREGLGVHADDQRRSGLGMERHQHRGTWVLFSFLTRSCRKIASPPHAWVASGPLSWASSSKSSSSATQRSRSARKKAASRCRWTRTRCTTSPRTSA